MSKSKQRILVVDDEPKIVEVVSSYLEASGYQVCSACSGREALELVQEFKPALVVLDLMLPDLSGEELCRIIRRDCDVPIVMLTAKVEEEDVLAGLGLGADDYVTKPFSPRLLVARVEAVLRRARRAAAEQVLSFSRGELTIDTAAREVTLRGTGVPLTPNEFSLLSTLASHPKRVFTRDELISQAMGDDYAGYDRVVDTHIKNLRQKLEDDSRSPRFILTVHGVGYRFGGERDEA